MKSNYRSIGDLVERIDERNTYGRISTLLGVSIDKCFIPSVANTVGTDLTKYKVIKKNDFAVSLMQVSRDGKIPVACQKEYEEAIMSPAYPIFRVKDENIILPEYLEMWFKRSEFDREAAYIAVGGVRGSMPYEEFEKMALPVPDLEVQKKIVRNYNIIMQRIALKQKINDNLEAQMDTLFTELIVGNERFPFCEPLDERIEFINGLAMQNFRPENSETPLPVIKIRELTQGFCDVNSEFCSSSIDKTHIIKQGDLIFSWSGSLQAAFWSNEIAGLNQHLFKVTSTAYPKWFVYRWILYHLLNFQRIAANKGTTFGHIKRENLHNALIKPLNNAEIQKLDCVFSPILAALLKNSMEYQKLKGLQQVLLCKLSN